MAKDDIKDPCRYCTDKPVCMGDCVDRMRYLNLLRADFKKRLAANKKCPATAGTVTER